jgi:hypothetical protein
MNQHDFTLGTPIRTDRTLAVLGDTDIKRVAPCVFAEHAKPGVSDRYQFVRTIEVVNSMRDAGYEVTKVTTSKARSDDGLMYSKHAVRLTHRDYLGGNICVGDVVPQVMLTNSHNRTSAFHLQAALERLACNNGLMISVAAFAGARVLHNDVNIFDNIIDGTNLVREVTESVALPSIHRMMALELSDSQANEFALAATYLKFGEIKPDHVPHLLATRRAEDEGRSLWAVLNRVQENSVKGGYAARDRAGRNVTVRGIQSVDRDLDFNGSLWQLGAKVAEELA